MQTGIPIQFHWSPLPSAESREAREFTRICHIAEETGIESVHVPIRGPLPDALALAQLAGAQTSRIRFRIGWQFRELLSSLLGRDLKQAWEALRGRLIVHVSVGNEELNAAGEFIANCRGLFRESEMPRFDVEGDSSEAAFLAIKHADCLWRLPHQRNQVYADALPILHFGTEVGLLARVTARETKEEALEAAAFLAEDAVNEHVQWITPDLWSGTSADGGEKTAALIGSFDDVALSLYGFKSSGISQFMIRESPCTHEPVYSSSRIVTLVRAMESRDQGN